MFDHEQPIVFRDAIRAGQRTCFDLSSAFADCDVGKLEQQIQVQEKELEVTRNRNSKLAAEVVDLKQGLEAVEEIARSEMGMVKEGEIFYQLIEPAPGAARNDSTPAPAGAEVVRTAP